MCRLRGRLQGLGRTLWAAWCGELGFHLAARRGTRSILRAIWDQESLTRFCQSREKAGRDGTTPQSPCLGRWLAGRLRGFSSRFSRFDIIGEPMTKKVKWGILSAASIARRRAVPGMLQCELAEVTAVASRSLEKAQQFAREFSIPKAYGSYEELLNDPEIEAIYNPLPNHLHVEWSIQAASRGKHVLCEKPVARTVAEARRLLEARDEYGVKIGEAFMVRSHPQWLRAQELVRGGRIGKLRAAVWLFIYFNGNPANACKSTEFAGGALMDIVFYPVPISPFLFGEEPVRGFSCMELDSRFKADRLTSAILEFPAGQ